LILFNFLLAFGLSVNSVTINGVKWGSETVYRTVFDIREGQRIDILTLRSVLKKAYRTEYFSDLAVKGIIKENCIDLIFDIKENPRLREISFQGNKKVKSKKIVDTLDIHKGIPLSPATLFRWKHFIEEMYRDKGYYGTKVEIKVGEVDEKGFADATVSIHEGKKARIKKIEFVGNHEIPDTKLKKAMKTKEKKWPFRSGKLEDEKFQEDLDRIVDYYRDHGFLEARVDSFKIDTRDKEIYIKIFVFEGQKYRLGRLDFQGNSLFSSDFLKKLVKLKEGDVFSQKKLDESLANIAGLYGDSGYIYVNILPEQHVREDSILDLTLHVFENHRVRVRKIDIEGNTKTLDEVIRREIDLLPGEYFSRQKVIKSQRDLYYLNYFENIAVDFRPTEDSSLIDLVFKVKEKYTGTVGLGASYSKLDGLSFYFQIQQPNFLGRGEIIGALVEYGGSRRNFQFNFTEPWLFGRKQSLGLELYHLTHYLPDYDEKRVGGSISYSRVVFNDYWRFSTTYQLERTEVYNIDETLLESPYFKSWSEAGPLLSSSITFGIKRDTRDRSFNATKGSITSYTIELSGGPLMGDVHFHKHNFQRVNLFPFKEKFISVFSIKGGYVGGLYKPDSVPFYERFFLGDIGYYGLRGYELRSVGPIEDGVNIGGRLYFIFTFEERYRISETMYLLAFFDVGNSWQKYHDLRPFIVKKGVGIGFRMEMPMLGIIGFDLGYGIDNDGGKWVPHIQFGTQF